MSQYFHIGNETLWNPSNGASRMFRHHVALFESELALPSGIAPMENDECQIDPVVFGTFVHALLAHHRRTTHGILLALSEGFAATTLALATRAGIPIDWSRLRSHPTGPFTDVQVSVTTGMSTPADDDSWAEALRERARHLSHHMAR
ncbi:DUF6086 family protein [Streptomyces sp. NPDC051180]|uniref:DUF6086 family protein n=1 Tax=unclassified Streptomyces TaxID=2593676 RepID=UPI00344BAC93